MRGGSILVRESSPGEVFTPEDFSPEQLQFAKSARDFMDHEVIPLSARIEAKEEGLVTSLLRKAGGLGLFMADVPEEYGGLSLDKASSALVAENLAGQGSFAVAFGAHVGIELCRGPVGQHDGGIVDVGLGRLGPSIAD